MDTITIRRPDDFHVHFRRGEVLQNVVPYTAEAFARAIVMPNLHPKPILTAEDVRRYREEILSITRNQNGVDRPHEFEPLMTIQIVDETLPRTVAEAAASGVVAGKVYPKGVTTNSHNGVSNFERLFPVFEKMQEVGMVLSLHGQVPSAYVLDREREFLKTLERIAHNFPDLRIVMEHISTKDSVCVVQELPRNVAATITLHHLALNLHHVLAWEVENEEGEKREGLNPHHYCQPILQSPRDQQALVDAVLGRSPKFFFGSDSAPHLRGAKESSCGCAGVFSAPVLLPMLLNFFLKAEDMRIIPDGVEALQKFTSVYGAEFYGLPLNRGVVKIVQELWTVPDECAGVVPFNAGRTLKWKVLV